MSADPAPTSADAVKQLAAELLAAMRQEANTPVLLDPRGAWSLLGLSRSAFFRVCSTPSFPKPVDVPAGGVLYRRADLLRWADRLKPKRRSPKRDAVEEVVEA